MAKNTVLTLAKQVAEGQKVTMVTSYDYTMASIVEAAGINMILVGDSLGMTMLGYDDTIPVTMDDMVHHTRAVTRATSDTFVVGDMPFMSYQLGVEQALANAGRLMKEGRQARGRRALRAPEPRHRGGGHPRRGPRGHDAAERQLLRRLQGAGQER